ncbi:MAG: hypothetical protein ABIA59_02375, partial [Candidatus Latescibacterota bacterium]
MRIRGWLVTLTVVLVLAPAVHAVAAERGVFIKDKGGWSLHPYLMFQQYYDNNPGRDPSGQTQDDWISAGRTGFRVMSPQAAEGGQIRLSTDLYGDWVIFAHRDKKGFLPALNFKFDYVPGTGFELNTFDNFKVTYEPPNNELTGLELKIENSALARLKYSFQRLAVS